MKLIPIKVDRDSPVNYKHVEWKLHNVCNYDCSFCIPEFKSGNERWKSIDIYKAYVDQLHTSASGKKVWILLSGGEPTLFPEFMDLCIYIKSKGMYVSVISNGSRSLRWWKELRDTNSLSCLYITYHSEQTSDYKHVSDVVNLFHDYPVETSCIVTHTPDNVDLSIEACEFFINQTGAKVNLRAMQIEGYANYTVNYTDVQLEKLKKYTWVQGNTRSSKVPMDVPIEFRQVSKATVTTSTGGILTMTPEFMRKNNFNNFYDWTCDAGIDTMRINYDTVWRAGCIVGAPKVIVDSDIPGTLGFETSSITCTAPHCSCAIDIPISKERR